MTKNRYRAGRRQGKRLNAAESASGRLSSSDPRFQVKDWVLLVIANFPGMALFIAEKTPTVVLVLSSALALSAIYVYVYLRTAGKVLTLWIARTGLAAALFLITIVGHLEYSEAKTALEVKEAGIKRSIPTTDFTIEWTVHVNDLRPDSSLVRNVNDSWGDAERKRSAALASVFCLGPLGSSLDVRLIGNSAAGLRPLLSLEIYSARSASGDCLIHSYITGQDDAGQEHTLDTRPDVIATSRGKIVFRDYVLQAELDVVNWKLPHYTLYDFGRRSATDGYINRDPPDSRIVDYEAALSFPGPLPGLARLLHGSADSVPNVIDVRVFPNPPEADLSSDWSLRGSPLMIDINSPGSPTGYAAETRFVREGRDWFMLPLVSARSYWHRLLHWLHLSS